MYGVLRDGWVTLWRIGFTGIPVGVVQFDAAGHVGPPLLLMVERKAEMLLDKGAQRRVTGGDFTPVIDEEWSVLYPTLYAHLTQSKWPDGEARQPSSLSLWADGPVVKCVLKDKNFGVCLWCACPTFNGLFGVIEALLCDPGAEWRVDRQNPGQKATRVKK